MSIDEWKIPVLRTPVLLHDKRKLKEIIDSLSEQQLKDFRCPCAECLVVAACKHYCIHIFRYMNYIVDHLPTMTADEICVYRHTVPYEIQQFIDKMLQENAKLAHPKL